MEGMFQPGLLNSSMRSESICSLLMKQANTPYEKENTRLYYEALRCSRILLFISFWIHV
jgi:hypothetical protein